MRKITSIPVPIYLKKFIEEEFKFDFNERAQLVLKKRMISYMVNDYKTAKVYFNQTAVSYPSIDVISHTYRCDYLYAFITYCRKRFVERMCEYVFVRNGMMDYSPSIREFLTFYEIKESEYSFSTAYKNWQRSEYYKNTKRGGVMFKTLSKYKIKSRSKKKYLQECGFTEEDLEYNPNISLTRAFEFMDAYVSEQLALLDIRNQREQLIAYEVWRTKDEENLNSIPSEGVEEYLSQRNKYEQDFKACG